MVVLWITTEQSNVRPIGWTLLRVMNRFNGSFELIRKQGGRIHFIDLS